VYDLYVDMDGVLADFDAHITKLAGGVHPNETGDDVWHYVTPGFFAALPKMPDADELWAFVSEFSPTIMTATGYSVKRAGAEKRGWAKEHLNHADVKLVMSGADKIKRIESSRIPWSILIDDRMQAISPWVDRGGVGILHTSASNTIAQLKEIGY